MDGAREAALRAIEDLKPFLDPYSGLGRDWKEKIVAVLLKHFPPAEAAQAREAERE